jgi:nucleoside 2-deoxyribosyltransferase
MNKRTIYLCGPMEAVSFSEANEWRKRATHLLSDNCNILDPCRRLHTFEARQMKRIFELDLRDIRECDIVLVNLDLMYDRPSHGTAQEMFYAHYILNKPVIAFKSEMTKLHPFMENTTTEWRSTVDKACETILNEYL